MPLSSTTVAECSVRNINHSFQVTTQSDHAAASYMATLKFKAACLLLRLPGVCLSVCPRMDY